VDFHWVETADHGFKPLKSSGRNARNVLDEVASIVVDWVRARP
jgi:hypothetical protein